MVRKRKRSIWRLILCIFVPLLVGGLAALLAGGGMELYQQIQKPPLSPPGIVFPIVWAVLYTLMGVASYLVLTAQKPHTEQALTLYGIQLLVNFFWPLLYFRMQLYLVAFLWLLLLIVLVAATGVQFYRVSRVAGYLFIPYFLWCLFAAYLNYGVYVLNL